MKIWWFIIGFIAGIYIAAPIALYIRNGINSAAVWVWNKIVKVWNKKIRK